MQFSLPRKSKEKSEPSIGLRVTTSAMAITGVCAVSQLVQSSEELAVISGIGIILGSVVSYFRRDSQNFWIKAGITWGILVVAGIFFQELVTQIRTSVSDARIPLTKMLVSLQALHAFDMPRRRDLNVSALVGLALIASTSTLSRSNEFVIYEIIFLLLGAAMLYFDCLSRIRAQAETKVYASDRQLRTGLVAPALVAGVIGIVTGMVFVFLPRAELTELRHVSLSSNIRIPFLNDGGIINRGLDPKKATRPDGSIAVNPKAYYGFSTDLDLNYRGELGDDIVLRVNSSSGQLWRGMAFDTFDGRHWTMSKPKHTVDRAAGWNGHTWLSPLPSFEYQPHFPMKDVTQTFYVESNQPNLIVAASVPYELWFPQVIKIDDYGSIRSTSELDDDTVYTVMSKVRIFDYEKLRHSTSLAGLRSELIARRMRNYLQLPSNLSPAVSKLAAEVAGNDENLFVQCENLSEYLKNHYKYDLNSPLPAAGVDAVTDFLFNHKRGSCEHFATAFVLLCRERGIPARMVTGFMPGTYNGLTGLWEVHMRDAHGWAEVFLPNAGWVSFDPTASGLAPGFVGYDRQSAGQYLLDRLRPIFAAIFDQPALKAVVTTIGERVGPVAMALFFWSWKLWQPLLIITATGGIVSYFFWRRGSRRQKKIEKAAAMPLPSQAAEEAQRLLMTVLADLERLEVKRSPNETVSELADRACQKLHDSADAEEARAFCARLASELDVFSRDYCAVRFGQSEHWEELAQNGNRIHEVVESVLAERAKISGERRAD